MESPELSGDKIEHQDWRAPETGQAEESQSSLKDQQLLLRVQALEQFSTSGNFQTDVESFLRIAGFSGKIPDFRVVKLDAQRYLESIKYINEGYLADPQKGSDEYDSPEGQQAWVRLLQRQNQIIDQILSGEPDKSKSIYEPGKRD